MRKKEFCMKIVVIDGQGGRLGCLLVERVKVRLPQAQVYALGTNSAATAAMLRAGADFEIGRAHV